MNPFQPVDGSTAAMSASTSTGTRTAILKQPTGRHQLRIANIGAGVGRYKVGDVAVQAGSTDSALPAGAVEVITVQNNPDNPQGYVSVITDSGTTTMEITTGHGI
jgi:hypothetical protein